MRGRIEEEWVVVLSIEKMLLPASQIEFATYNKATGAWIGWTSPGYRSRRGQEIDSFPTLRAAIEVVRQIRPSYPHVTAVCIIRVVKTAFQFNLSDDETRSVPNKRRRGSTRGKA